MTYEQLLELEESNGKVSKGLKGFEINRIPEAKFDNEPCNAKPIARPAAPTMATNEVVLKPK